METLAPNLSVHFYCGHFPGIEPPGLARWETRLVSTNENFDLEQDETLATALFYVCSTMSDALLLLDSESSDTAHFLSLLGPDGLLSDEIDVEQRYFPDFLIWDRVAVQPKWRGRGYGPLLGALSLQQLGRGCSLVACQPAPYELHGMDSDSEEYRAALDRLRQMWGRFGFDEWKDDIWILDLASNAVDRTIARFEQTYVEV